MSKYIAMTEQLVIRSVSLEIDIKPEVLCMMSPPLSCHLVQPDFDKIVPAIMGDVVGKD